MWPLESCTTPCVFPHLMCAGSTPQSCIASYVWAPLPITGARAPALSCMPSRMGDSGAAAVAARNSRLVVFIGLLSRKEFAYRFALAVARDVDRAALGHVRRVRRNAERVVDRRMQIFHDHGVLDRRARTLVRGPS